MKLVTFQDAHKLTRAGAVVDERVLDLSQVIDALALPHALAQAIKERGIAEPKGISRLLWAGSAAMAELAQQLDTQVRADAFKHQPRLAETRLLAPIPRPGKIIGIGRNYADHAKETGLAALEKPRLFAKLPSSVVGFGTVVKKPANVAKLDFEGELGVVIGAIASNVAREHALEVVAGYTVLNDLSAREFQFDIAPPQTSFAKSMDGFCPMGPWLVTKDEIKDAQQLEIKTFVNDVQMQHGHTSQMLFPIDRIIEYLSAFMTLEPGDVIATGTPAGVGAFRDPPLWLKAGDRMRIEISQVGALEHAIG